MADKILDIRNLDITFTTTAGPVHAIRGVNMDLERGSFRFIHASVSQGVTITSSTNPYFMMRLVGTGRILPD